MPPRVVPIRRTKPTRLDRALAEELEGSESRSSVARLIRAGCVRVNGAPAKPSTEVGPADEVLVDFPEPEPSRLEAEDLTIGIVHEDEHLVVVDKPAGMITHPAGPIRTGTLVNALLHRFGGLSAVGGGLRPGIVHRLDKGTSGLLVVARDDETHRRLARQLAERTLSRTYVAVAWGRVTPEERVIDAPIGRHPRDRKRMAVVEGGKEARTRVRVRHATDLASVLEVDLETGRTHQIRVHLTWAGHPLVGDAGYGGRRRALAGTPRAVRRDADRLLDRIGRPALHAWRLRFVHPWTGEDVRCEAPVPPDVDAVVRFVRAAG
jgi:23S rRNA pseudouridine1911/1915/1917 synthase